MARGNVGVQFARVERWASDAPWMQSLIRFMGVATGDRDMQVSGFLVVAALWLTLAFGDPVFLLLLIAAAPGVWWYRRADHEPPVDDDW
jgi:hypothetical protein